MVREDLQKIYTFYTDTLRPLDNELEELKDSRKEAIDDFCTDNHIEKKVFNEALRRSKKDLSDEVDMIEMALRGDLPDDN